MGDAGECAGIFSPHVVVFRDDLAKECAMLPRREWVNVSVVSVAALACPPLIPSLDSKRKGAAGEMQLKLEKDVEIIKDRWRMVLRMAAQSGKSVLLLAALGCGVWKCPPRQVAEMLQDCLREQEFEGWFKEIWVGIYDREVCTVWEEAFHDTG